jgi:hypothetical protein
LAVNMLHRNPLLFMGTLRPAALGLWPVASGAVDA